MRLQLPGDPPDERGRAAREVDIEHAGLHAFEQAAFAQDDRFDLGGPGQAGEDQVAAACQLPWRLGRARTELDAAASSLRAHVVHEQRVTRPQQVGRYGRPHPAEPDETDLHLRLLGRAPATRC